MVRVAIVGVTGYAGSEAYRLLWGHPGARVTHLASHSRSGAALAEVWPHLAHAGGSTPLQPVDVETVAAAADVALLALPARQSLQLAPALCDRGVRVIDFGADFRLRDAQEYARHYGGPHQAEAWLPRAAYGLTEFHRADIAAAPLVANPGCYPTAAVFALRPALAAGDVFAEDIVVDAKSGASGAGRQATATGLLAEAADNLQPYRLAGAHRHTPEIEQELALAAGRPVRISFSPHLVPMPRGLLATCYARLAHPWTDAEALARYRDAYADEPFVQVLARDMPATKATLGTNMVQVAVRVDARVGRLVAVAAIDNLGKGAAGQAVQNLNVMFALDERAGLPRVALVP